MDGLLNPPIAMVLLVGGAIVLAAALNSAMQRTGIPALVGFLLLGVLMRLADEQWGLLAEPVDAAFTLLGNLGLVALLFRVGLRSDPKGLLDKLPRASAVWVGNAVVSALAGFGAAYGVLGLGWMPSLVVATALTATSVGVSVSVWDEAGRLHSDEGTLLVDVAELDDLSGVALMALLFATLPAVTSGDGNVWHIVAGTGLLFVLKLALFTVGCVAFARYAEQPLTRFAARRERPPERMLTVAGLGFVIAALAGALGLSLAVGALFAGLAFSRDPEAVRTEARFTDLYAFFAPFFFIRIGLQVDPEVILSAVWPTSVLLVAGVAGKLVGTALPAWPVAGGAAAWRLGVSMIPRAEIAMVVIHQGRLLGADVVPERLYAGMVGVTLGTCVLSPLVLRRLLGAPAVTGERA